MLTLIEKILFTLLALGSAYTAYLAGEWDAALAEGEQMLTEDLADNHRLLLLNNVAIIRVSRGASIAVRARHRRPTPERASSRRDGRVGGYARR